MSWRPSTTKLTGADWRDAFLFFLVAIPVYFIACPGPTGYDQYSRFADAMLHGAISLPQRPPHLEMAEFNGRAYFSNPPTPAIVLLPVVGVAEREPIRSVLLRWNGGFELPFGWFQTGLSIFLGALNVALARLALGRVPVRRRAANWGAVLFGFGSIHWYHATIGSVWYLAQTTHATFFWLAVLEWLGRGRGVLIGLCLAAAFWCRMETIVAVPFILVARPDRWLYPVTDEIIPRPRLGWLVAFAAPLIGIVALNAGYNWIRFGVFGNEAYELLAKRAAGYGEGLFNLNYWPAHVHMLFRQPPIYDRAYPWIIPAVSGLSIWYTTPAFIYALRAPLDRLTAACWVGILLFLGVLFQFGGTGMTQFGYRFALDFYPLLTLLTVRGMDRPIRWWHLVLILVSVAANAWGIWVLSFLEVGRLY